MTRQDLESIPYRDYKNKYRDLNFSSAFRAGKKREFYVQQLLDLIKKRDQHEIVVAEPEIVGVESEHTAEMSETVTSEVLEVASSTAMLDEAVVLAEAINTEMFDVDSALIEIDSEKEESIEVEKANIMSQFEEQVNYYIEHKKLWTKDKLLKKISTLTGIFYSQRSTDHGKDCLARAQVLQAAYDKQYK